MSSDRYEFSRSARRHRIGKGRALSVIHGTKPQELVNGQRLWVGHDDRGMELEIIAVERPDCWLVIHVMPMQYRRRR